MQGLFKFDYVNMPHFTGNIESDAVAFLYANNKPGIAEHVLNVAIAAEELAIRFCLDRDIVRTAAILHDISGVLKPSDMMSYALSSNWWIDES